MVKHRTKRGISVGYLPPPNQLGAPKKYEQWRDEQEEALVLCDNSEKDTSILQLPVGSGKSLFAVMYAWLTGKRTVICTKQHALANQYDDDLGKGPNPLTVDIRGMNNYRCPALEPGGRYDYLRGRGPATCDRGPCKSGLACELRSGGCPGYDQVKKAQDALVVVTNYANWMVIGKAKKDEEDYDILGKFDMIVCDEVHEADDAVTQAMTVEIKVYELERFFGTALPPIPRSDSFAKWTDWIGRVRDLQTQAMSYAMASMRNARDHGQLHQDLLTDTQFIRRLGHDLRTLEEVNPKKEEWLVELIVLSRGKVIAKFLPVWPGPYCEKYLFRGIERRIGMSGTVVPEQMKYLGLKPGEFDFWEFESSFPVENRPFYYIPAVYMSYGMPESEKRRWVHVLDGYGKLFRKLGKGIVHSVSYDRATYYRKFTKLKKRVVIHDRGEAAAAVVAYKKSKRSLVIVTPSMSQGYDFENDFARWQVLGKMPFRYGEDKLMKKRTAEDKTYLSCLTARDVVQAYGRIVRNRKDWGITVMIDATFGKFYERFPFLFPSYFREAVQPVKKLPKDLVRRWRARV